MEESGRKLIRVAIGLLKRESVFYCPEQLECRKGTTIIVSRAHGLDWGIVLGRVEDANQEITESALRIATDEDFRTIDNASPTEEEVDDFNRYVKECGLEMNLVGIDHCFDRSKVTFYFCADGRVDFRELVRRINRKYCRRVELYQLNLEDQFRMFPAFGICGMEICCRKIKGIFGMKVSSRTCKDQKLIYNPQKMSGCCGKARCCFTFEHESYAEFADKLPKLGGTVSYRGHDWRLSDWDVFSRTVVLYNPEYEQDYRIDWQEFKDNFGSERAKPLVLSELFGTFNAVAAGTAGASVGRGRSPENAGRRGERQNNHSRRDAPRAHSSARRIENEPARKGAGRSGFSDAKAGGDRSSRGEGRKGRQEGREQGKSTPGRSRSRPPQRYSKRPGTRYDKKDAATDKSSGRTEKSEPEGSKDKKAPARPGRDSDKRTGGAVPERPKHKYIPRSRSTGKGTRPPQSGRGRKR